MARGRLAANPGLGGDGLARAGVILGWVGVGLAVAMLVVGAAFLTAFASSSSSRVVRVGL